MANVEEHMYYTWANDNTVKVNLHGNWYTITQPDVIRRLKHVGYDDVARSIIGSFLASQKAKKAKAAKLQLSLFDIK